MIVNHRGHVHVRVHARGHVCGISVGTHGRSLSTPLGSFFRPNPYPKLLTVADDKALRVARGPLVRARSEGREAAGCASGCVSGCGTGMSAWSCPRTPTVRNISHMKDCP